MRGSKKSHLPESVNPKLIFPVEFPAEIKIKLAKDYNARPLCTSPPGLIWTPAWNRLYCISSQVAEAHKPPYHVKIVSKCNGSVCSRDSTITFLLDLTTDHLNAQEPFSNVHPATTSPSWVARPANPLPLMSFSFFSAYLGSFSSSDFSLHIR